MVVAGVGASLGNGDSLCNGYRVYFGIVKCSGTSRKREGSPGVHPWAVIACARATTLLVLENNIFTYKIINKWRPDIHH